MTWTDKAKVNDVLIFCKTWKSREEIREHFKFTNIEAWHCVRWIGRLSDVSIIKKVGLTSRAYMYRTRHFSMIKILEEIKLEKEADALKEKNEAHEPDSPQIPDATKEDEDKSKQEPPLIESPEKDNIVTPS